MLYWDARDFILSQLAQVFICGDYRAEPCNGPSAITHTLEFARKPVHPCHALKSTTAKVQNLSALDVA